MNLYVFCAFGPDLPSIVATVKIAVRKDIVLAIVADKIVRTNSAPIINI